MGKFIDDRVNGQPKRNHKKECAYPFVTSTDYVSTLRSFMNDRPDSETCIIHSTNGDVTHGTFVYVARGANKTDITRKFSGLRVTFVGKPITTRLCACTNSDDESCTED